MRILAGVRWDPFNMDDAFHLGDSYAGAFRARLDANLAFWDALDGKQESPFVVTRGGEYCFAPSLSAMRWIAELDT